MESSAAEGSSKDARQNRPRSSGQSGNSETTDVALPVRELMEPGVDALGILSTLSLEQIAAMEKTLQRVKMNKLKSSGAAGIPTIPRLPRQSPQVPASPMKQFMSTISTSPKTIAPTDAPSIKLVDEVPWLTFSYSTKSGSSTHTIRADVAAVELSDISQDFRTANCLYPSADGPEEDYKGTRREFERECNEQGWKLAHLNPILSGGKKGLLQRAVVSLRNTTSEQRSRRAKRQVKAAEGSLRQRACTQNIPTVSSTLPQPQRATDMDHSIHPPNVPPQRLLWQPTLVSSMKQKEVSLVTRNRIQDSTLPGPSQPNTLPEDSSSSHNVDLSNEGEPQTWKPPSLGSFQPSLPDSDELMEFEGFVQGRSKKLWINHRIERIDVDSLTLDFKKANCVYPRAFLRSDESESESWKSVGVRHAEESYLNEIGWKLCFLNQSLLGDKRLLLQQALDAYRRRFLPSTCQPRARIGPSILAKRTTGSKAMPRGLRMPGGEHHHPRHRRHQQRVRFHTGDEAEDEEEDTQEQNDDFEADVDSGGEDSLGGFQSQMSLLSFTGRIRTYNLGDGSGSARSRPRINPKNKLLPHVSTGATSKKRTLAKSVRRSRAQTQKRTRRHKESKSDKVGTGGTQGNQRVEIVAGEGMEMEPTGAHIGDDIEEEDDWWMSRLQNSTHPEDHNFVSMSTEELINALTTGYEQSETEGEDEEEEYEDERE